MFDADDIPCLLEDFDTVVERLSTGHGNGTFQPKLNLSTGTVDGRKRVLGTLEFQVLNCAGDGGGMVKEPGKGKVKPTQSAALEDELPFLRDGDQGKCKGVLTMPNGSSVTCQCRFTLKNTGRGAASDKSAKDANGSTCNSGTVTPQLALRFPLTMDQAALDREPIVLRIDGKNQPHQVQRFLARDAKNWNGRAVLEFGIVPDGAILELRSGRKQEPFSISSPPNDEGGTAPFTVLRILSDGYGKFHSNRARIYFRPLRHWRPSGAESRVKSGKVEYRVLDMTAAARTADDLAREFLSNFAVDFNGGLVGRQNANGHSLPQQVEFVQSGRTYPRTNLARVVRFDSGAEIFLGFQFDIGFWLRLCGVPIMRVDLPDIHVDWVRILLRREDHGFAAETLRRDAQDWAPKVVNAPDWLTMRTYFNRHHILAGRRSWVFRPVLEKASTGVFFLETAAVERYSRWMQGKLVEDLRLATNPVTSLEAVEQIWTTLLVNYVAARGFEVVAFKGVPGPEWRRSRFSDQVFYTEAQFDRYEVGDSPLLDETYSIHPTLREQFDEDGGLAFSRFRPGLYVASRNSSGTKVLFNPISPTHQFLVLIPENPNDFNLEKDSLGSSIIVCLGRGAKGIVVGAHKIADENQSRLRVRFSERADLEAAREYSNPVGLMTPDFDLVVGRVDHRRRPYTIDNSIREVLSTVHSYERNEVSRPIFYPRLDQMLSGRCLNGNSWAQSVIEHVFGPGAVRQDFPGFDPCSEFRIDPIYFKKK